MLWMCSELTLQPRWCLGKSVRYPEGGDQGDMSQSPAVRQPSDQRDKLELQWPAALVLLSIKQPVGDRGGKVAFGGVSLLFSQIASHLNNTDIQFLPLLIDNCGARQHELLCPSLRGTDSDDNHSQKSAPDTWEGSGWDWRLTSAWAWSPNTEIDSKQGGNREETDDQDWLSFNLCDDSEWHCKVFLMTQHN